MPHEIAATFCVSGSAVSLPLAIKPVDREAQRDPRARDRRGARAAIGLDHVAIEHDLALAEQFQIGDGAERTADQPLDFLRAARLLALGGLAAAAGMRRAGEHAIFGGHPTLATPAQERRDLFLDRGGDEHLGVAETDQHRSLGMFGEARFDADRAHLIGGAA